MNFLGIGPFELLLILVIATIVLGPERMAQAGRTLGRLYGQYRIRWQKDVDEMTRELRRELEMLQQEVEEIRQSAESEITAAQTALEGALDTKIDLGPLTAKEMSGSGATRDAQSDQDSQPLTTEQSSASVTEPASADQVSAPTQSAPPSEHASSAHAAEESSAEVETVPDVDSAPDSLASSPDADETADPPEPLSRTVGQSTHSERGEAEGEHS